MRNMTVKEFKQNTGYKPINDDLERVTCLQAGEFGHQQCGWCEPHWKPRFMCGCLLQAERIVKR